MTTATVPGISVARQTLNFVRHFFEMCIPMCVGGFVLYLLAFTWLPDVVGWGSLRDRFPEASLILIALFLSAPMTAWMAFPRHAVAADPGDGRRALRPVGRDHRAVTRRSPARELAADPVG
jgi:hypothetical protein